MNGNKHVTKAWLFVFAAGIVLILTGIFSFVYPWTTYIRIITYAGYAIGLNSIFILIHALAFKQTEPARKWLIGEGLLDLIFATIILFNPFLSAIAFPFLAGYWIIIRGVLKMMMGWSTRHTLSVWYMVVGIGVFSVGSGLLILFHQFDTAFAIPAIISGFSIAMGILYLYDALHFRRRENTLLMME